MIENLEWRPNERNHREALNADLSIEAFGSRITRPRGASYVLTITDIQELTSWLSSYLEKNNRGRTPFRTVEPVFEIHLTPISGNATEVSVLLMAFGTKDGYFKEETGPAIRFQTMNDEIVAFKNEISNAIKLLTAQKN